MSQPSRQRTLQEPHWSDWSQCRYGDVPVAAQAWLRDTGSLTRRVIQHCEKGTFRVRLVKQGWGKPLNSERQALHIRPGRLALVRDVVLICDDIPWVFARTIIPVKTLKGPARRLMQLGERPLGAVLFSDPKVSRGSTLIAKLTSGHTLFDAAGEHLQQTPDLLWGRRTLFFVGRRPILVNELFLPDLPMQKRETNDETS